ncbi:YciI family protein [Nocardia rosealba]|uniref:YciI family protein n=1 Tax=Nocardia TaxID=1817 RepID=UPI001CD96190|nr:YciI family protein [Nocardia rosealba]MCA2208476.1 YciI family protein [Nocardia rosealba]
MSQYLVLIYGDEPTYAAMSPAERADMLAAHRTFQQIAGAANLGGHALQPTATATSIRHDATGEVVVTDGPFAEAKEALGGYYLLEAPDLDAAIALAAQVPTPTGGVEVRPIQVFEPA